MGIFSFNKLLGKLHPCTLIFINMLLNKLGSNIGTFRKKKTLLLEVYRSNPAYTVHYST